MAQRLAIVDKQWRSRQRYGRAAEGVFECGGIMHLKRHNRIGADCLEQACHVASRDGIARLGAPVLARIAEVRHDSRDPRGAGIFDRTDQEQQPAQLVVRALGGPTMKALHDIDVGSANIIQGPRLVFAVFEISLLVRRQWLSKGRRDTRAEILRCPQGKELQAIAMYQPWLRASSGSRLRLCHVSWDVLQHDLKRLPMEPATALGCPPAMRAAPSRSRRYRSCRKEDRKRQIPHRE
jgi:hypothetical protein